MITNFREIQRRVQARIQNTSTSISEANDLLPKIKDWINIRYDRVYRSFPWDGTIDDYTFTLTASTKEYVFEREVFKVWAIFDQTNGRDIKQRNVQRHFRFDAVDTEILGSPTTGDSRSWYPVGTYTVNAEIGGSAETVDVVSTSALDITPNVVRVVGNVGGVQIGENVVLTGTSTATTTNTFDANQKLRVSVGTSTGVRKSVVGKITVSGNTSSTVFAEVSPQEFAHEYHWFRVSPQPKSSGTQPTWQVWHSLPIEFLVDDNDIPIIDCANELEQGAFSDALKEDGLEQEGEVAEGKFVNMVKELMDKQIPPAEVQQFIPFNNDAFTALDFGRVIFQQP